LEYFTNYTGKQAGEKKMNRKSWLRQPLTYFWIFSNFLILFLDWKNVFRHSGIDTTVILFGNFILFAVSILSFWMMQRSLKSSNPQSFMRAMYGSFIAKFFVVAITAFVYIQMAKKEVNKPGLFICMGLYIVYTFLEVSSLMKMLKQKKNA
jgi:hypothetical protein